ncbi:dihydroorotate dehydrogenase electron transfer subunit [Listeria rocourtiae]|uniref:dihydroorotate dehydrogenase electron transfer subunit n=1 Tax=Listeria rocourtiae TaxID=647910 RepID=UPI0017A8E9A0|nr:dihydroorotate dehydrogenase electron transfer subunit [Listeria rocourtiae]MBC1435884.1 dihydroorotate dehydrogenase electron transfer subunit [Listeria rocourtiae]
MRQTKMEVVSQKLIADRVFELILQGDIVTEMHPGQFMQLKPRRADLLLRRPISICGIDKAQNQCTLLYRVDGDGTADFAELVAGDTIDVIAPLGNGFAPQETKPGERALLIGGGIGVPPLYQLGKDLVAQGSTVTFVLGFSSAKDVFYEKEMGKLGDCFVATVDGTQGVQGFVTTITDALDFVPDTVYSCGPTAMLRVVAERFANQRTFLSLEERMACGVGACYACICQRTDDPMKSFKACDEGPVFRAGEVVI